MKENVTWHLSFETGAFPTYQPLPLHHKAPEGLFLTKLHCPWLAVDGGSGSRGGGSCGDSGGEGSCGVKRVRLFLCLRGE